MIGLFSEDYLPQHLFWSDLFFAFNLIVLILANASLLTRLNFIKGIGYYGFGVAVVNLLFVVLSSTPLLEWFTVFTALGYVALLAYNTLRV
jgi:lipopolysaccharide export LptBFGC system permease protein LptF